MSLNLLRNLNLWISSRTFEKILKYKIRKTGAHGKPIVKMKPIRSTINLPLNSLGQLSNWVDAKQWGHVSSFRVKQHSWESVKRVSATKSRSGKCGWPPYSWGQESRLNGRWTVEDKNHVWMAARRLGTRIKFEWPSNSLGQNHVWMAAIQFSTRITFEWLPNSWG